MYRAAVKPLARSTPLCIFFDGENISFDASLVMYINRNNIPCLVDLHYRFQKVSFPFSFSVESWMYRAAVKPLARSISLCIFLMVRIFLLMLVLLYVQIEIIFLAL